MAKIVVLNGSVANYDGTIDWSSLGKESGSDVVAYEQTPTEHILDRVQGASIIVTKEMGFPAEIVRDLPSSVNLIVEAGTGYNNHDVAALQERGISLANVPAYSTQRVAHTAIMLMLNLASTMQTQLGMIAQGNHKNFSEHLQVPHVELNGKTFGVIGYGNIGKAVIRIAQAMDMKILVASRTPRHDADGVHFTTQTDLLKHSDVVSLNLPLNPVTRHLINADTLALMKKSAFLVNTSRGGLVDEEALIDALRAHRIAGAGLDVQENEPLADDSPLFDMDNVILTPHIGWKGFETRQRLVTIVADDINAFLAGAPINVVA